MTDTTFQSATIPQDRLLPGIHGLRGLAAVAVVLFHVVHIAGIPVPPAFGFIASDFGKGVHLFFVLSAFALMHSTEHTLRRSTWAKEYFIKRFFRIAPLFYLVLALMVCRPLISGKSVDIYAVLLNLTLMFGLAPWSGIVWAGWTVGVEVLFYCVLPVLLLTVRTARGTFLLLLVSMVVTYAARMSLQTHFEHTVSVYRYNWSYFSFPTNLCFFVLGMYAYRLRQEMGPAGGRLRWGIAALASLLLGALSVAGQHNLWHGDLMLWGLGFAGLALWQSQWPSTWSANRVCEHLGERSYSLYLVHPLLIQLLKTPLQGLNAALAPTMGSLAYFVCAAVVLIALLAVSEVTYRFVEVPSILFGQRVSRRVRESAATSAVVS